MYLDVVLLVVIAKKCNRLIEIVRNRFLLTLPTEN